jgi:hypothetical protein
MSDITPPTPINVSLPNAKIRVLQPDGTFSLPWRLYFQNMFNRTGGSSDEIAQIIAELVAAVVAAQAAAEAAEEAAAEAVAAAQFGSILGPVGVATLDFQSDGPSAMGWAVADPEPASTDAMALALVALGSIDLQVGGASGISVQQGGSTVVLSASVLNFTGDASVTGSGSTANIAITGGAVLPLVNGTTPFLGFVHTPDGQCIGVPI